MRVTTDHAIEERGDNRMILKHFTKGHAYIVAERQHANGKWTVSCVDDNVHNPCKHVTKTTRAQAIEAMTDMALKVLEEYHEETGERITGYSCLVPYHQVLEDGTKVKLHDKP